MLPCSCVLPLMSYQWGNPPETLTYSVLMRSQNQKWSRESSPKFSQYRKSKGVFQRTRRGLLAPSAPLSSYIQECAFPWLHIQMWSSPRHTCGRPETSHLLPQDKSWPSLMLVLPQTIRVYVPLSFSLLAFLPYFAKITMHLVSIETISGAFHLETSILTLWDISLHKLLSPKA